MTELLNENAATVILLVLIAFCVFLAVRRIVRDRKSGKGTCGGNCAGCEMSEQCAKRRDN